MGLRQRFRSADLAPDDETWHEATPAQRLAFFREAGDRMLAIKRAELAGAIGSNGRRMKRRKHPRADGANGPVLTPHGAASRTSRPMRAHATVETVTLYWLSGHGKAQRTPWGSILAMHAAGIRGGPSRDVRLSRKGLQRLRDVMRAWWAANHAPALLKARAARLEAEEAARKKSRKPADAGKKAAVAMAKRYRGLAAYLFPKRGGGL